MLGQSWGGMLGAEIAVRQPAGLARLAICNSPASMQLWVEGAAELRAQLPTDAQEALTRHEDGRHHRPTPSTSRRRRSSTSATSAAWSRCRPDFVDSEEQMEAEPTVYHTMNGPNEFHVIGTMRDWTIVDRLTRVAVPTLVVAGEHDEATPATWAALRRRHRRRPQHVFAGASHCTPPRAAGGVPPRRRDLPAATHDADPTRRPAPTRAS